MANISKITLPNGITYDIKDANPPEEIFIAEFNETSYDDLYDAYEDGKMLYCRIQSGSIGSDQYYPLLMYIASQANMFIFGSVETFQSQNLPTFHAIFIDGLYKTWSSETADLAELSHTHGNITSGGQLQTTDVTVAAGDKLVITDSSDSNNVARTGITFDGNTTNKYLSPKGTWETLTSTGTQVQIVRW